MTKKEQILEMYQIMYDAIHMQKCPKEIQIVNLIVEWIVTNV